MRKLPAKAPASPSSTKYYAIENASGRSEFMLSADGRKWYAKQGDGSWRKCPPNISIMLSEQMKKLEAEQQLPARFAPSKRADDQGSKEQDMEAEPDPVSQPASPTGSEPPSPSSGEAPRTPASTVEP